MSINIININNAYSLPFKGTNETSLDTAAHTTDNMKLVRPKVGSADFTAVLNNRNKYSDSEASKQLNEINNDIYHRSKQEKEKHEFNFKRYFTIFGILSLLALALSYFRRK